MIGRYPLLVLGPTSRGRSYGVVGRSEQLGISDAQVTNLSIINHDMVDYLRPGDTMVCQFRVPDADGWHFLSVSNGMDPIGGNAVVMTCGIVLASDDIDRFGNLLPLLAQNAFEDLAGRPSQRMEPLAVDWATLKPASTTNKTALRLFGGLVGEKRLRLRTANFEVDPRRNSTEALTWFAELFAWLPPGRAADLTWSTYPASLANWNVAQSASAITLADPPSDGSVVIEVTTTGYGEMVVSKTNAVRQLIDTGSGWLALVQALISLPNTTVDHGKALDHFRTAATANGDPESCITARCAALLQHMASEYGDEAHEEWLSLLAQAAARVDKELVAIDLRKILRGLIIAVTTNDGTSSLLPAARSRIVEHMLDDGGGCLFAQLHPQPGEKLALANSTTDALRYWNSLFAVERTILARRLPSGWERQTAAPPATLLAVAATLAAEPDPQQHSERIATALGLGFDRLRAEGVAWSVLAPALQQQLVASLPTLAALSYDTSQPRSQREVLRAGADRVSAELSDHDPHLRRYRNSLWQFATGLIAQTPRNGCEINAPDRMALFDAMTSLYRTKTAHLVKGH